MYLIVLSCVHVSTGVSVTSSNTGVPDISGSVYTKTQVISLASCKLWFLFIYLFSNFFYLVRVWSNCIFLSLSAAVVWEAGFSRWHTCSFIQPALSLRQRWSHQPPGCCWICPAPVHAHPGTAPTTPFSDSAPPPPTGWTGILVFLYNCLCYWLTLIY